MLSSQRLPKQDALYLRKNRNGVYYFRWSVRIDSKHHQPSVSLKTRNFHEAVQLAVGLIERIRKLTSPTVLDIKAIYSLYTKHALVSSPMLSELDINTYLSDLSTKSQKEYESCWNGFVSLVGSLSLDNLQREHIEQWKESQTCSSTTLKKKLRLLSSCFSRIKGSVDCGLNVQVEWFRLKADKKPTKQRRALTRIELNSLLKSTQSHKNTIDNWKYYLPRIAALTGCRLNELAQLRVSDVVLSDNPVLSINDNTPDKKLKNASSEREIPLTTQLKSLLTELIDGKGKDELLFNLPYSPQNGYVSKPSKYFSQVLKTLEIDCTFHALRHYAITELFNAGVKEELIGSLVGHSVGKLTTGKIYLSGFTYENRLQAISNLTLEY
ncbi:tyrosine-type recombinase/integrase [Vibrio fluvialis]|uniref:tyrosine-type recombinase/integrase n=1 Tax=Vibrio fluvialis TaxID=676 RepID=UPI0028F6FAD2|nr:tyrosine-type recombinase/integrase [Vibrio fluvialis]